MILIDEHIRADGALVRTHLERDGDHVIVVAEALAEAGPALASGDEGASARGVRARLSLGAIEKVMRRYGRPLDDGVRADGPRLDFPDGHALIAFRFHAVVDAEARDYLAWSAPGEEPIAALSNGVAAALRYLAMRLTEES